MKDLMKLNNYSDLNIDFQTMIQSKKNVEINGYLFNKT